MEMVSDPVAAALLKRSNASGNLQVMALLQMIVHGN